MLDISQFQTLNGTLYNFKDSQHRADKNNPHEVTNIQTNSLDNSSVAHVELTTTASKNYSIDDKLVLNSILYKVIQPIAQNDTFIVDTNIQRVTVEELIDQKQDILTFDNVPTIGSNNPVKSGGVYLELEKKADNTIISPVEVSNVASREYEIGDYLILDGVLYLVTIPIAVDDTIVVDTNVITANVTDEFIGGTNSLSGDIVSFDSVVSVPVKALTVGIEPVQSGSGDPSPDNVRPISGWTGANIVRTGKNLIKGPFPEYTNYNGTTWRNNADGSVSVTGTPTQSTYCRVQISLPAGTYIVSGAPDESATGHNDILIQDTNQVTMARDYKNATANIRTFTLNALSQINVLLCGGINYPTNCTFYPMIRLVSNADSTYTPYSGTTIPITWQSEAGTVYGGTLDVLMGKLRVTHGNIESYNGETLPGEWISSMDVYAAGTTPTTGAQVVYELATPITYPLSDITVQTLAGPNVMWADTGPIINLEYRNRANALLSDVMAVQAKIPSTIYDSVSGKLKEDVNGVSRDVMTVDASPTSESNNPVKSNGVYQALITKANNNIIAPVENGDTSTNNYSVGNLLIHNNVLYRVTTAIAIGDTITSGTNVAEMTVAEMLDEQSVKKGTVSISATWSGTGPYTQTVTVTGTTITENSQVSLQPTAAQIAALADDNITAIVIENNAGILTAYAVGGVTAASMTIDCTVTEVRA